jgi:hypothetical protein
MASQALQSSMSSMHYYLNKQPLNSAQVYLALRHTLFIHQSVVQRAQFLLPLMIGCRN